MLKIVYKIYRLVMNILEIIMSGLNSLIIKRKRILFYNKEVRDNSKYLMEYALEKKEYQIICYTNKVWKDKTLSDTVIYTNNTIKMLYYYLTSEVVIYSFDLRFKIKPKKNQRIIQLWHGSPLKTIGHDEKNTEFKKQRARFFTDILCANELFRSTYMRSFGCLEHQIKIWGNPRNDLLFKPLKYEEVLEMVKVPYTKMLLWMPTYRQSKVLHNKEDSSLDIPIINKKNMKDLNKYLEEKNTVIVIKPHPLQDQIKSIGNQYGNIILLSDSTLNEKGYELYNFVGAADALITDYSSIYFDYLLLDRPIGFAIEDIEEYKNNRGFIFETPEKLMPGSKLLTIDDLRVFIDDIACGIDNRKLDRRKICDLTNYYQDDSNCRRIYEEIKVMLESE